MIKGKKRALEKTPSVNLNLNASIHNRFDIEVVDARTGEVRQKAVAHNIICNNLWTKLLTLPSNSQVNSFFQYIQYGTGEGIPSVSDTSLFSYLGNISASTGSANYDAKTGVFSTTKSGKITESQHVGATITEIGIAAGGSSSGQLCTHAMLQDMNGNQISILKTDSDIINIYATVFLHLDPTRKNGMQFLPVVFYSDSASGHIASILSGHMSGSTYVGGIRFFKSQNVYMSGDLDLGTPKTSADPSSKSITFGPVRVGADAGNIGGLFGVGFSFRTSYSYDNYYPPFIALFAGDGWFPGSDITGESVGTGDGATTEFALKFPYATNGKVYVDGVEATNAAVKNCPTTAKSAYILQLIDKRSSLDNIIPFVSRNLQVVSASDNMIGTNQIYYGGEPLYFYNPMWEIGLDHFTFYYTANGYLRAIEFSDDLSSWESMDFSSVTRNTDFIIPGNLKHKKFFRITAIDQIVFNNDNTGIFFGSDLPTKAIVFDTPPAAGVVITADYHTPVIAKDENHVFDVSLTIHCGEYSPNA